MKGPAKPGIAPIPWAPRPGKAAAAPHPSPVTHPFEDVNDLPATAGVDQQVEGRAGHGVVDQHHRTTGQPGPGPQRDPDSTQFVLRNTLLSWVSG